MSIFDSPLSKRFEKELREFGEIQEHGLGKNWFDRTVAFWQNAYEKSSSFVKDTWQKYLPDREKRESSPDRESGLWNDTVDRVKGFWQKYVSDRGDRDNDPDRDDLEQDR